MREKIENKRFENKTLILDSNYYNKCIFNNCVLIFNGDGEIGITNCEFNGCNFTLGHNAKMTINFLRAMYSGMGDFGKLMVEDVFKLIKNEES